jgi:hypothetical protein
MPNLILNDSVVALIHGQNLANRTWAKSTIGVGVLVDAIQ